MNSHFFICRYITSMSLIMLRIAQTQPQLCDWQPISLNGAVGRHVPVSVLCVEFTGGQVTNWRVLMTYLGTSSRPSAPTLAVPRREASACWKGRGWKLKCAEPFLLTYSLTLSVCDSPWFMTSHLLDIIHCPGKRKGEVTERSGNWKRNEII